MDAYCEHLGAHLGYGGTSRAKSCSARSTGGSGTHEGRNVCIPYEDRPNRGRRIRTYPVVERNESVYIWHDVESRDAVLRRARRLRRASATAAAPPTTTRSSGSSEQSLEMHPQYVLENGVDFAHFKFVHETPIVPVFTRHDFDDPVSYVDFTITFEGDDGQKIEDVNSGVEAINGGLGIAVTKSWGMVDNRTISAITPVDEYTSDVRFMVYIGRTPGEATHGPSARRSEFGQEVIRQFSQDIHIWAHQRYSDPPALASVRVRGVHRDSQVGHAVLSRRHSAAAPPSCTQPTPRKAERNERISEHADPGLPGRHRQRRLRDDQADRHAPRPRAGRGALLLAGQDRPRRRRARRAGPIGVIATGTGRGDHRREARRADLPRRVPRRGPLRAGARGRHQHRHHGRLDHRLAPRRQPPAPVGQAGPQLLQPRPAERAVRPSTAPA